MATELQLNYDWSIGGESARERRPGLDCDFQFHLVTLADSAMQSNENHISRTLLHSLFE